MLIHIQTFACGLNFKDVLVALGTVERETGFAMGLEAAGKITYIDASEQEKGQLAVGDDVMGFVVGGLASHSYGNVFIRKPSNWSYEEAAGVPVVFVTVWYALRYVSKLQSGQKLLVHSATGGVGRAAVSGNLTLIDRNTVICNLGDVHFADKATQTRPPPFQIKSAHLHIAQC